MLPTASLLSVLVVMSSCVSLLISPAVSLPLFKPEEARGTDRWGRRGRQCYQLGGVCCLTVLQSLVRLADAADSDCGVLTRWLLLLHSPALCPHSEDDWQNKERRKFRPWLFQKRVMGNNGM